MASHRRTRLNVLITEYFSVIALVLVLIAAGGTWATYATTVEPGSHTEQRVVSSWQTTGEFAYSATVVNATPLSERGDIRTGRKFYFTNAMPVLDGRFDFGFEGANGDATVTTQTTLVNYAVYTQSGITGPSGFQSQSETRNRSETRLWEITTPLGTERKRVETGETASTTFSIDISDIRERIQSIDQALGPISQVTDARTAVAVSVHVNGIIGGERVKRSFNYTLPINTSTGYYVVYPPQKPDTQQFDVTRIVTVQNDYGILITLASLIGLFAPLVALAGLFYGRENDWFAVSQAARADAQRAKLRAEFEEWVTSGTVATDDRTTIVIDSLEGLVDVAIDSDRRVIEDDETGVYVVLDDDVRYEFTPEVETTSETGTPPETRDSALPPGGGSDEGTDSSPSTWAESVDGEPPTASTDEGDPSADESAADTTAHRPDTSDGDDSETVDRDGAGTETVLTVDIEQIDPSAESESENGGEDEDDGDGDRSTGSPK